MMARPPVQSKFGIPSGARLVVLAAIATACPEALAQSTADASQSASGDKATESSGEQQQRDAHSVFDEASRAYEERRYRDAIDLFLEADKLSPNAAFAFNIGMAYEDMGDATRALSHYRDYVRRAPTSPDRDAVDGRIQRLEKVLQEKGIQQISVLTTPPGALLSIDGKTVGATPWTGELSPGSHELLLQLRGFQDEKRHFDLPPSRAIDVPVTMQQGVTPPAPAPAPTPAPETSPTTEADSPAAAPPEVETGPCQGMQCIGLTTWISGGVAVAFVGGSVGFLVARSSARSAVDDEPDQIKAVVHADAVVARERWAVGTGIAGALVGAAFGVLAYQDLENAEEAEAATPQFAGGCQLDGCSLLWQGSF